MNRIVIAAVIGLAALSSACTENGSPQPTPTTASDTPTSTSKAAASGLASMKPCDLLTESEVTSLGLRYPGEQKKVASAERCSWLVSGNGGLAAGIRADKGAKDLDLRGDKVSKTTIGKFEATKIEAQDGAKNLCTIVISVTESASVQVIGNLDLSSTDTAGACERATKAAELIAPKLS